MTDQTLKLRIDGPGMAASHVSDSASVSVLDMLPLPYLALPSVLYLVGWVKPVYGIPAAIALIVSIGLMVYRTENAASPVSTRSAWVIVAIASLWSILGGVGHFVYANFDWTVRDAVLLDLVQKPWPVLYDYGAQHLTLLLRAPTGLYLPSAAVGKIFGIRAAEVAMLGWIVLGVVLILRLMLRDTPSTLQIAIRLGVFILFSGMDIVGNYSRHFPIGWGQHIEWWAFIFQYPAMTTQLFWAPGHALPAWIVTAWLTSRSDRRLPIPMAVGLVAVMPMWSPLAALGVAPLVAIAILKQCLRMSIRQSVHAVLDARAMICVLVSVGLVFPYLVLGSQTLSAGFTKDIPWVSDDIVFRYLEFVVVEFALVGALLLWRFKADPLLIGALAILLLIPIFHFGPANDLALRASNPGLAFLAIRAGEWLSTPLGQRKGEISARMALVVLLGIGAVTPLLEVSRLFVEKRWDMNVTDGLIEAAHGRSAVHYLTTRDQPWPDRFLK